MFFDSHFFTMLMYRSPIDFSTKVLDIFLFEGEGTNFNFILVFLMDLILRILQLNQN